VASHSFLWEWLLPLLRNADGGIQLWQHDLHPIWLRRPDIIQQKLHYIHMNPVKDGLVEEPHHYLYSSARDEAGLPGMLKMGDIWGANGDQQGQDEVER
jgi:putative transposase